MNGLGTRLYLFQTTCPYKKCQAPVAIATNLKLFGVIQKQANKKDKDETMSEEAGYHITSALRTHAISNPPVVCYTHALYKLHKQVSEVLQEVQ